MKQEGRRERNGGSGGRAGLAHTTRARKGEGVDDKETTTTRRSQQLGLADDDGGGCAGAYEPNPRSPSSLPPHISLSFS